MGVALLRRSTKNSRNKDAAPELLDVLEGLFPDLVERFTWGWASSNDVHYFPTGEIDVLFEANKSQKERRKILAKFSGFDIETHPDIPIDLKENENQEFISQSRDILRDMIALIGSMLGSSPQNVAECLAPVIDEIIKVRTMYRQQKKWAEADDLRNCLERANIVLEDTKDGSRWHLKK